MIKTVTIFLALATLVLKPPSFYLTWNQFLNKKYQFDKNNLYLKNISWLIFSLHKIESIFSIIATLDKMEYEFENKVVLEVVEKLVITVTNLLICYLIVKVSYARPLVIIKLMFISIEFEIFRKPS